MGLLVWYKNYIWKPDLKIAHVTKHVIGSIHLAANNLLLKGIK
jgi:hypothetical protein